jgi:Carboxypeptidase regulatory-like domain
LGQAGEPKPGNIVGTVTDVNGDPVPDATVELKSSDGVERRALVTPDNGYFEFHGVKAGTPYEVNVTAVSFAGWSSPPITIAPGEFKIVTGIQLRIQTELTEVQVHYDPVEVATEQLKVEETQRVFGIIPNFYVTYDKNAAPLTAKMKFQLALKVSIDPVTIAGVAFYSAVQQAGDTPNYGQGAEGYGKRVGANAATGFSDIMIGGAILPTLLHQDPRYFYQGTGTTSSRARHAIFSPFVARGDNGNWQPNYSSLGGDLAAAAISNTYYPRSDRGIGLVFGNFAIGTAERIGASLAQEFVVGKFTRRAGHME